MGEVHAHPPHELSEPREQDDSAPPRLAERRLELVSVLLLPLTRLATHPRAIPGPLYMPQYRSADQARSAKLDAAADALYTEGTNAKLMGGAAFVLTLPPA